MENPDHQIPNDNSETPNQLEAETLGPSPFINKEKQQNHPFKRQQQKKMLYLIIGIVLGVLIFGALIIFLFNNQKGTIVLKDFNDSTATVSLNGGTIKFNKNSLGLDASVYPGEYHLTISKPNYIDFNQDISVGKGQTIIIRPSFALIPTSSDQLQSTTIDFVRPSIDQNALYYLGDNRQNIYRLEITNRAITQITNQPLVGVEDIEWSGNPDVAIIVEDSGVYLKEIPRYNFVDQKLIRIGGSEIISPIWDPNNPNRMAFAYEPSTGEKSLVFTSPSMSPLERLADIRQIPNPLLVWSPDSRYIALIGRSTDYSKNNIWIYTLANGNLSQITKNGNVMGAKFSPDSTWLMFDRLSSNTKLQSTSTIEAIKPDGTSEHNVLNNYRIEQVAWKDSNSFYAPDLNNNTLTLNTINGSSTTINYTFSNGAAVSGMFYFSKSGILVYYTNQGIYTVNLGN